MNITIIVYRAILSVLLLTSIIYLVDRLLPSKTCEETVLNQYTTNITTNRGTVLDHVEHHICTAHFSLNISPELYHKMDSNNTLVINYLPIFHEPISAECKTYSNNEVKVVSIAKHLQLKSLPAVPIYLLIMLCSLSWLLKEEGDIRACLIGSLLLTGAYLAYNYFN